MSWQPPPPPPRPGAAPQQQAPQTYYQLLQVDPNANPTIIRYAYRFLAAMFHPDNAESGDAEKFKTITEAWRTLSDGAKRQAYDMQLGVKQQVADKQQAGQAARPTPKASLSWSEV